MGKWKKLEWMVYRMLWSFHEGRFPCKRERVALAALWFEEGRR